MLQKPKILQYIDFRLDRLQILFAGCAVLLVGIEKMIVKMGIKCASENGYSYENSIH